MKKSTKDTQISRGNYKSKLFTTNFEKKIHELLFRWWFPELFACGHRQHAL